VAADSEADEAQPAEPKPCAPCRGTGKLNSNLGGTPQEVECPWCDGTGVFMPGHDAQATRRGDQATEQS
jgi:DnaJ-class molecular chaperone